jgi:hypothetical protein
MKSGSLNLLEPSEPVQACKVYLFITTETQQSPLLCFDGNKQLNVFTYTQRDG